MKVPVFDAKKGAKGEVQLPRQFDEPIRQDLISRAVFVLQAAARQPYGSDPMAGMRTSAKLSRRRRKYRGSYGAGISRVPRKILSRRGTRMNWVGAFAPGTVGGRRAHPPKVEKVWTQKINDRERQKAIRSALAATIDRATVEARGHKLPPEYPFLIEASFESISKTSQAYDALFALGFGDELARSATTKVRGGRAKMRGRKTKRATSLLIVCSDANAPIVTAAANIPGVTIVAANAINAELLAPGTHPGRATLFTESAIKAMEEQNLFLDKGKKPQHTNVADALKEANAAQARDVPRKKAAVSPAKKAVAKKAADQPKTAQKAAAKGAQKAHAGDTQ